MTETELDFNQKLIRIQAELRVPKTNYSDYGGYNFRNAEDILKAVKKQNLEYGLLLTLTDVPIFMDGRFYIKATATLTDGKDSLQVEAYAREADSKPKMDDSQVTGSASSYARKYALQGLYLIDDGIDSDSLTNDEKDNDDQMRTEFTNYFNQYVQEIANISGTDPKVIAANILGKHDYDSLDQVTPDFYQRIIGYTKVMVEKTEQKVRNVIEPAANTNAKQETKSFTWGK
jgi:hypothetical protein